MNTANTTNTNTAALAADVASDAATSPHGSPNTRLETPAPGNDNAANAGIPDTTALLPRPEVERCIRAALRRRVAAQDMNDAVADVQVEALAVARTRRMPANLGEWIALTATIAARRSLNRQRNARRRRKYDAGLCEEPDAYMRPTLHWEQRDPVDTKRYLAILKELFDSGQMPEHGQEILQAEADEVDREEIAAELGLTTAVVSKRLFRMRTKFRARLAALGMLVLLMMLLLASLVGSVGGVGTPAPQTQPAESAAPEPTAPAWDGGFQKSTSSRGMKSTPW